jgi:lipoyl(octanoyl) transferase
MEYQEAWDLQKKLQDVLIRAKRENVQPRPPHVILSVEHPPVFTLGKSGDRSNLIASDEELASRDATFHHIDRGGDITFHGPGQLVVYPILDLDRIVRDIHIYLRELEEAVIKTCTAFGVAAGRTEGRTGVWVGPDVRGPERKICAIGIRCSRWVTMHGLAFNIAPDLSFFGMIIPCGISDRGVTSLAQELGHELAEKEVRDVLLDAICDRFKLNPQHKFEGHEAMAYLREFGDRVSAYSPQPDTGEA